MFKTELEVRMIRGSMNRELLTDLVYVNKEGMEIVVPKGFLTNFASVPESLRSIVDESSPEIIDISVVHDYLYSAECAYHDIDRKKADKIFRDGMMESGASNLLAQVLFRVTRFFGKRYYER